MSKEKILVTGSKGFIGASFLQSVTDNRNVIVSDYIMPDSSCQYEHVHPARIPNSLWQDLSLVVHMGALSLTNSTNTQEVFDKNIKSTLNILDKAKHAKIIYASSASIYGSCNSDCSELGSDHPESIYAHSKHVIDQITRLFFKNRPIVGLRFFNVCSFVDEAHKKQPSPTFSFYKQLKETEQVRLFHNSDTILRDFIYIEDVIKIIHFFIEKNINQSYIINVGTGCPISFEAIADNMIEKLGYGQKVYIDPPFDILDSYQAYTQANITLLRNLGYTDKIPDILSHIEEKL